jgi:cyclopropane-fatty-acyl-phospholipid synthase
MSDAAEIRTSYDVSNEFFQLFLDDAMSYSCAVFDRGGTLEEGQRRKLEFLADGAAIGPESRVLDVGCGWGANLAYLVGARGVREAHGITLSGAQHARLQALALPGVGVELVSYQDFAPDRPFDAIESIGMLEHVCTPEQARRGEAATVYRDYFRRAHGWSTPGARFALQTVVRLRIPRGRDDLRALSFIGREIFPGAMSPRLEEVIAAASPYWEIVEVHTRRHDYARTCALWLERLRARETEARARFGDVVVDRYLRYLAESARLFSAAFTSLAQLFLQRLDQG